MAEEVKRRFPVTASLALASLVISLLIGVPIGIVQGMRPGSKLDKALLGVVSIGLATPGFFVATLLIFYFAVKLNGCRRSAAPFQSRPDNGCVTSSLLRSRSRSSVRPRSPANCAPASSA